MECLLRSWKMAFAPSEKNDDAHRANEVNFSDIDWQSGKKVLLVGSFMKIVVRVKTNARKNLVEKVEEGKFLVSVSVPPVEGKANERVIELLAGYFGKPKRNITIIRGATSKEKLVEVL